MRTTPLPILLMVIVLVGDPPGQISKAMATRAESIPLWSADPPGDGGAISVSVVPISLTSSGVGGEDQDLPDPHPTAPPAAYPVGRDQPRGPPAVAA
jgi:hypothetical protein